MSQYRLTLTTTNSQSQAEGDANPIDGQDARSRIVWSTDDMGRGASVSVKPLGADKQSAFHAVGITVIPSLGSDDEA